MTRKLLIMCGTGIATSTVVYGKISEWLKEKGHTNIKLYQSKIADELNQFDQYDIIVSTTLVPDNIRHKVIDGLPLLTGMGIDAMYEELEKRILALDEEV